MLEHHTAKPTPTRPSTFVAWVWWAFFENADDGYYGDAEWRKGRRPSLLLAALWWFRNPAHNFCFYVIGFADEDRLFIGDKDWGVDKGWSLHWCVSVKTGTRRPLVSYRTRKGRMRYIGWRPYGAFGIAFRQ